MVVQGDAYALPFACDPVITQKQKFLVISRADFAAGKRLIFEFKCIIERTVVHTYVPFISIQRREEIQKHNVKEDN